MQIRIVEKLPNLTKYFSARGGKIVQVNYTCLTIPIIKLHFWCGKKPFSMGY